MKKAPRGELFSLSVNPFVEMPAGLWGGFWRHVGRVGFPEAAPGFFLFRDSVGARGAKRVAEHRIDNDDRGSAVAPTSALRGP